MMDTEPPENYLKVLMGKNTRAWKILHKPLTILKHTLPLFAPHWEEYIGLLLERGHSESHLRNVLNRNCHFHQYLVSRKMRCLTHVTPQLLSDFLRLEGARFRKVHGRSMPKHYLWKARGPIKGFLTYAFSRRNKHFLKHRKSPDSLVITDRLLDRYMDFCCIHRGLRLVTREGYRRDLLRLRSFLERRRIGRIQKVTLADLDDFLLHHSKHLGVRGLQSIATALRSFFRYLHLNGDISRDLAQNVLSPRRFHADLRPKYLPWKKIEQLLASVNRSNPGGKRDYAILVLLAYHGLRAREAAGMRIGDIDWIARSFLLRERKNGAAVQIPMSQETTVALRDYMSVRPDYPYPEFFLTTYAPSSRWAARFAMSPRGIYANASAACRIGAGPMRCAIPTPRRCWTAARSCTKSARCWAIAPSGAP